MKLPQIVSRQEIALRDLYPTLTEDELKEAEENLRRHLKVAWEIHQEISKKKPRV